MILRLPDRRRAVRLWTAAGLLFVVPLPLLAVVREGLEARLRNNGALDLAPATDMSTGVWLLLGVAAVWAFVAGCYAWRPVRPLMWFRRFASMLLLVAVCLFVYWVSQYLSASVNVSWSSDGHGQPSSIS